MATVTVRLYRDSLQTPWGFRVQGGADFHTPLTVQRVFTGSPAESELHRGDIVTGIENCDAASMLHREAQDIIRNSGGTLLLNIRRPHGAVAPAAAQQSMTMPSARSMHAGVGMSGGGGPHSRGPSQPTWRPTGPRPEFGVQYGSPQRQPQRQQPQQQHQLVPQQARDPNAVDGYMMDKVNRSLATMDLTAAGQRALDDQEVDYGFMQQSVADRRKAFMQPTSYGSTYNSVPRHSAAGAASAARYRQKWQPDPALGQRAPEFGWSPSSDKLRAATRGYGPSTAGFEQQSYLPSQGQGVREDSPFGASPAGGRRGGGHRGGHRVGGGAAGGGGGGSGGRQRTSATLRLNSTGSGDSGGGGGGGSEVPLAFNKQYNTPINMYSKQNVVNAFEGQMGVSVGAGPPQADSDQPAYTQSQVYKLVQEQDQRRSGPGRQQQQNHHHHHQQPPPQKQAPWVRQQSEGDDGGVTEF